MTEPALRIEPPEPGTKIVISDLPPGPQLDTAVWRIVHGPWDASRCPICGWRLYPDLSLGCVAGNCSMRPPPDRRADAAPALSKPYTAEDKAALLDVILWVLNCRELIWFVAWGILLNNDLQGAALRTCRAVVASQKYQYVLVRDDGKWMFYHG